MVADTSVGDGVVGTVIRTYFRSTDSSFIWDKAFNASADSVEELLVGQFADLFTFLCGSIVFGSNWANLTTVSNEVAAGVALAFVDDPNLAVLAFWSAGLKRWFIDFTVCAFLANSLNSVITCSTNASVDFPDFIVGAYWFTNLTFRIINKAGTTLSTFS